MTNEMNNNIYDNEKSLQESYLEEVKKDLAENPPEKPTLDEFKEMVRKDAASRRKKHGIIVVAACAAFLFLGYFAFDLFTTDVGADKNPKEEIMTEDGVIIEDGGWGSDIDEENVWVIDDWNHIEDAKKIYPDLLIPRYVPSEYSFTSLNIIMFETDVLIARYIFTSQNKEIEIEFLITEDGESSTAINDVIYELVSKNGKIYIQNLANKKATIQLNSGINANVWANISDEEYIKIANGIQN